MASMTRWTEFEQALGVGDGQGSLACCSPWNHKEWDTTERMNWTVPLRSTNEMLDNVSCSFSPTLPRFSNKSKRYSSHNLCEIKTIYVFINILVFYQIGKQDILLFKWVTCLVTLNPLTDPLQESSIKNTNLIF